MSFFEDDASCELLEKMFQLTQTFNNFTRQTPKTFNEIAIRICKSRKELIDIKN